VARRRADLLIAHRGLATSRTRARALIEGGLVTADGRPVLQPGDLLDEAAALAVAALDHPWVGRGGVKLAAALDRLAIDPAGTVALDLGASTGGFTEVLLARGAVRVYAVDVGHGQLDPALAADPRVVVLERTDARDLGPHLVGEPVAIITADMSFIGLAKALPAALALAGPGARLLALVKPQFEVGPAGVGRGGIVRDEALRQGAVRGVAAWLEGRGWAVLGTADSPHPGGRANRETFIAACAPG
jgi:23S rRNA (cytidine1920-2'-O)/16S rRNA (cytidine1409-2'-O)-methyltransferase